jgi:hypothetical protein
MRLRPPWPTTGTPLTEALQRAACTASGNATVPRGHHTLSPLPLIGPSLALLFDPVLVAHGRRGLLLTRA